MQVHSHVEFFQLLSVHCLEPMDAEGQLVCIDLCGFIWELRAPVDLCICEEVLDPISVDAEEQLSLGKSKATCRKEQRIQHSTLHGARME